MSSKNGLLLCAKAEILAEKETSRRTPSITKFPFFLER